MALISLGDITLTGQDRNFSFFQGLIYTEGSFRAEQITLLGTLIANPQDDNAEVFLKDSNMLYSKETAEVEVALNGGARELYFNSAGKPMKSPHPSGFQLTVTLEEDGRYYIGGAPSTNGGSQTVVGGDPGPSGGGDDDDGGGDQINSGDDEGSNTAQATTLEEAAQAIYARVESLTGGSVNPGIQGHLEAAIPAVLADLEPVDRDGDEPEIVTVEPSQFITLSDSIRVVLWRDL